MVIEDGLGSGGNAGLSSWLLHLGKQLNLQGNDDASNVVYRASFEGDLG